MRKAIVPLAALLIAAPACFAPVLAEPADAPPAEAGSAESRPAAIAFANHGGVDDWRALSDREIWFRESHNTWFRATLLTPAFDLLSTETIGIDAGPSGTLDKFGGITVKGRSYSFATFERMPGPPPKKAGNQEPPPPKKAGNQEPPPPKKAGNQEAPQQPDVK